MIRGCLAISDPTRQSITPGKHDVGASDESAQRVNARLRSKVDGHAALSDVLTPPTQAAVNAGFFIDERRAQTVRGTLGRFDDDDFGSEFSEHTPAHGRELVAYLHDAEIG
ncbi:hypothetical protein MGAD_51000 [Mycolicibacterium gadium]|uniref:Uncharacterized protein n=1 Tax=Mycolicibacterium gadium TaxID=1794 RepID=A0A7I7WVF2_MYCGU|nr:hypothetical protein MGAD_51000 [Mycolicibacterium gadium]